MMLPRCMAMIQDDATRKYIEKIRTYSIKILLKLLASYYHYRL
jgi:hypothetical protein